MPLTVAVWTLTLMAVAFFLRETRDLFIPMALALLVSYALVPVVAWFDRFHVPRGLSAAVVVGAIFAAIGWTAWWFSDDVMRLVRDLPGQLEQIRAELHRAGAAGVIGDLGATSANGQEGSGAIPGLFALMGHVVVVGFLTYFLLVGDQPWHVRLVRLSGIVLSSRRTGAEVLNEIASKIQRILWMQVVTSVVVCLATGVALSLLDAPGAWVWAVVAGIFNWIPYFGPVVVSAGLFIVGFIDGGVDRALQLSLTSLAITSLEGWLLTPMLLGRAVRVNTIAVFVSLMFWSWAWGVWGTLLAVPITSVVKVVADHVEPLQWLSHLLSEDGPVRPDRSHA